MRHHYVPQFLLEEWAQRTKDGRIETFRLDLTGGPSSRHTPKHTAYEPDLYALTVDEVAGMSKQAVETRLMRLIDDTAARVLQKFTSGGFRDVTAEDRVDWARFLMCLRVRQPDVVYGLRIEAANHLEATLREQPEQYEALTSMDDPPTLVEWTRKKFPGLIENIGVTILRDVVENPVVGVKILQMKWWLWDFRQEKNELLIADNPCIFTQGIDDPDLVIALPIGPTRAFMATKTERVAEIMRQVRPSVLLARLNESSLRQARVRIYACNTSPERFIRNRLPCRGQS